MNGYSVEEAAEVLGIPQGRVWELIARGVLAGASEGSASMRVYLRGTTPTPAVAGTESDETSHANGNGHSTNGESHGEMSPFRELLTEFRNLTERYGQALLALGEARGEVAALRSRVDLLEARMDMRLPMRAASTVAWEMPAQHAPSGDRGPEPAPPEAPPVTEPAAEPPAPAAVEPPAGLNGPSGESVSPQAGRSRRYGTREAVAGLAEALARAEDPTLASLPGASEAAQALAALQEQVDAATAEVEETSEPAEASFDESPPPVVADELSVDEDLAVAAELDDLAALAPSIDLAEEVLAPAIEEPATESVPAEPEVQRAEPVQDDATGPVETAEATPDESPASPYTTDVIEPDWFADGDFAWLESPGPKPDEPLEPEETPPAEATLEPAGSEVPAAEEPTGDAVQTFGPADAEPAMDAAEPWSPETDLSAPEEPVTEEIQEAFDDAGGPTESAALPPVTEEPVTEEIQEAFEDAGPTRAEAIPIEPDDSATAHRDDEPPSTEFRSEVAPQASTFGLYRGQPEGPMEAAAGPQPATAVRDEEAVMWLGDDFEAGDLEQGTSGWRDGGAEPQPIPVAPGPLQLSDAEIEQLASSEGWDDDEVAAIRGLLGRAEPEPEPAVARQDEAVASEPPVPVPDRRAVTAPTTRAIPIRSSNAGPEAADWLQGRRGPAASAYRRLRRIFQG